MLKIVRIDFPLQDKPGKVKNRPALCLTEPIGKYRHVIVAPITSKTDRPVPTDVLLDQIEADFSSTGLSKTSVIQLHKLVSLGENRLLGEVGSLSAAHDEAVHTKLRELFKL